MPQHKLRRWAGAPYLNRAAQAYLIASELVTCAPEEAHEMIASSLVDATPIVLSPEQERMLPDIERGNARAYAREARLPFDPLWIEFGPPDPGRRGVVGVLLTMGESQDGMIGGKHVGQRCLFFHAVVERDGMLVGLPLALANHEEWITWAQSEQDIPDLRKSAISGACRALKALYLLDAAHAEAGTTKLARRDAKRAAKRRWRVANTIIVRGKPDWHLPHDEQGNIVEWSHGWWRRAYYAHHARGPIALPHKMTPCVRHGRCRRVWVPLTRYQRHLEAVDKTRIAKDLDVLPFDQGAAMPLAVPDPPRKPLPAKTRARILERDDHACRKCGATESLVVDHVVPVALGGGDEDTNLQVLCAPCNGAKGTTTEAA